MTIQSYPANQKIFTPQNFLPLRKQLSEARIKLVFTNGCFDLLHPGHIDYLEKARALGDRLIVAVNTDESVRQIKGPPRPIIPLEERLEVLVALQCVNFVTTFSEATPREIIKAVLPDVLVKGSDWSLNEIVGRPEVEAAGGRVVTIDFIPGYSTSGIIEKILRNYGRKK